MYTCLVVTLFLHYSFWASLSSLFNFFLGIVSYVLEPCYHSSIKVEGVSVPFLCAAFISGIFSYLVPFWASHYSSNKVLGVAIPFLCVVLAVHSTDKKQSSRIVTVLVDFPLL